MTRASSLLAVLAAASLAAWAGPARAAGASPQEVALAQDLLRDALREQKAGHCPDAIEILEQAIAIAPSADALLHLGQCLAVQGRLREALAAFERAAALAGAAHDKAGQKAAEAEIAPVAAKLAKLVIALRAAPEAVAVTLDGERVATAAGRGPIRVDPGEHVVRAEAAGYAPFERRLRLAEGESAEVAVALTPAPHAARASAKPIDLPKVTWIAGGAAVLLAAGGAVTYAAAGDAAAEGSASCARRTTCDGGDADTVRALDATALGMWIVAGVGATVAVTWLVADRVRPAPGGEAGLHLTVGAASASLSGAF